MSANDKTRNQPWSGRFAEPTSELVQRFTASISFDRRLAEFDVEASIAHSRMLHAVGIIGNTDLAAIEKGLAQIRSEIRAGAFPWSEAHEDVHFNIERRLIELAGEPGKTITFRQYFSRDDKLIFQSAADRMWVLDGKTLKLVPLSGFVPGLDLVKFLALPLIVKEQVIGALGLVDTGGRVFTEDDVRLAQAFADQAAVALDEAVERRIEVTHLVSAGANRCDIDAGLAGRSHQGCSRRAQQAVRQSLLGFVFLRVETAPSRRPCSLAVHRRHVERQPYAFERLAAPGRRDRPLKQRKHRSFG